MGIGSPGFRYQLRFKTIAYGKALFDSLLPLRITTLYADGASVYPAAHWQTREPAQVGLSREKLDAFKELVGGRDCVVRQGYMVFSWVDQTRRYDVASAMKPVISALPFIGIQEGKLNGVAPHISDVEWRPKSLNGGKDAGIAWRHLASQTSGYGLVEKPGEAWSYNDFALALYFDTLTGKGDSATGHRGVPHVHCGAVAA